MQNIKARSLYLLLTIVATLAALAVGSKLRNQLTSRKG